jgi:hypothetical protein
MTLWHRGNTYLILKRLNLAETDLRASLKNARGSGNVCMEARSLMDLAAIVMTRNDLLQAVRYLKKAERICWELGDTETLSWVEARWSDYYMLKGDKKEAALHRSKAMGVNYPHPFKLERDLMFNLVRPGTEVDRRKV